MTFFCLTHVMECWRIHMKWNVHVDISPLNFRWTSPRIIPSRRRSTQHAIHSPLWRKQNKTKTIFRFRFCFCYWGLKDRPSFSPELFVSPSKTERCRVVSCRVVSTMFLCFGAPPLVDVCFCCCLDDFTYLYVCLKDSRLNCELTDIFLRMGLASRWGDSNRIRKQKQKNTKHNTNAFLRSSSAPSLLLIGSAGGARPSQIPKQRSWLVVIIFTSHNLDPPHLTIFTKTLTLYEKAHILSSKAKVDPTKVYIYIYIYVCLNFKYIYIYIYMFEFQRICIYICICLNF